MIRVHTTVVCENELTSKPGMERGARVIREWNPDSKRPVNKVKGDKSR